MRTSGAPLECFSPFSRTINTPVSRITCALMRSIPISRRKSSPAAAAAIPR
jgi:hypothetical protein